MKANATTRRKLANIGDLFRRARERANVSQAELAERIGMHRVNYIRFERGRVNMTVETMMRVAGGLGLDLHVALKKR